MTNDSSQSRTETIVLPEGTWRETSTPARAATSSVSSASRRWGLVMLLCGIAFATYGSLLPFDFKTGTAASVWAWVQDFPRGISFASDRIDFFSNVCLFVPIGLGGMAWLTRNERSLRAILSLTVVMAASVTLSFVCEGAQTMLPSRTASYSDVVAQSIGAFLGCFSWIIFGRIVRRWLARLEFAHRGHQRVELFLQGYFVFQFCMSVFPLDVTIQPADLYHKLQRGQINLIPFVGYQWNGPLIAEMLFFSFTCIPYGALATRLWMPPGNGLRNRADSLALGMAMVVGIEFCQLFVQSRFTDATQVVMGAGGVLVGVVLMHALWPRGSADGAEDERIWLQAPGTWYAAAMLYAFIPAAFLLWPFEFVFDGASVQQELHDMLGIPFNRLLLDSPLPISTIVIRDLLLFWPLGLLLGAGIHRTRPTWRPAFALLGVLSILSISLGIELLQSLVPQRHADLTDVLLSSAAGIVGMGGVVLHGGASWRAGPVGPISTGES